MRVKMTHPYDDTKIVTLNAPKDMLQHICAVYVWATEYLGEKGSTALAEKLEREFDELSEALNVLK